MLQKLQKRNESGFTIIEVLIVLAIAALILLIVFLAVPALQRNSRNNSRKNDASRVATAVSNFASNNNGSLPGPAGWNAGSTDCITMANDVGQLSEFGSGTPSLKAWCNAAVNGQIAAGNLPASAYSWTTGGKTWTVSGTADALVVDEGSTCPVNGATAASVTTTPATARNSALLFTLETSSGLEVSCISAT